MEPMREPKTDLAERILTARSRANVTQERLAEMAGVTKQQVSAWERGVNVPRYSACIRVALALGVDPVWLRWGRSAP